MKVIGISGKMGVGKTTVATMLCKTMKAGNIQRMSFGDLLKSEVSSKFGVPIADCYDGKDKLVERTTEREKVGMPRDMTVRELLQWYGTDVVRARDQNYWIKAMQRHLRLAASTNKIRAMIIDDVRFPNEAELVRQWRGLLVRIDPYPGYEVSAEVAGHASETALDNYQGFDMVFRPKFGEAELEKVAREIAERMNRGE